MAQMQIFPDIGSLVAAAADFIADLAVRSVAERGRFTIALAGGNTPRPVYERLATPAYADRIDWNKVEIFFGDERCVPPEDKRSNYQMARAALCDHVPIPAANIHRIHGEQAPEQAALEYEAELRAFFGADASGKAPKDGFDLVLLGMGDNGHTASIFPGLAAVTETERWVMAQYVEVMGMWRVTLTPVVINAARHIAFLVSGADKAEMLQRVLEGPYDPVVLPAQIVRPVRGEVHWLLDQAAAARLAQMA
jgi:6-phosphogluconolactonase